MTPLDLRALLAALHGAEVHFVLVGGVAVGAHGYVQATADVDVVPDPSAENVRRLGNALVQLGADSRALDVVQPVAGSPGFSELNRLAVEADLLGVPVRVCSLAHLRAMKQARGDAQDLADLERLPSN